jgi:hypothetical protein
MGSPATPSTCSTLACSQTSPAWAHRAAHAGRARENRSAASGAWFHRPGQHPASASCGDRPLVRPARRSRPSRAGDRRDGGIGAACHQPGVVEDSCSASSYPHFGRRSLKAGLSAPHPPLRTALARHASSRNLLTALPALTAALEGTDATRGLTRLPGGAMQDQPPPPTAGLIATYRPTAPTRPGGQTARSWQPTTSPIAGRWRS